MKNPLLVIAVVVITLLVAVFLISSQNQASQNSPSLSAVVTTTPPSGSESTPVDSSTSRYLEYSKTALDQSSNQRRVLFFYANWCPTCRPADADFRQNSGQIPTDLTVIRVNYNDTDTEQAEKDLADKYSVTYQHTYVQIDSKGDPISKWNGGQLTELLSRIK